MVEFHELYVNDLEVCLYKHTIWDTACMDVFVRLHEHFEYGDPDCPFLSNTVRNIGILNIGINVSK